jgi:drug/metabolite transporter (DMT)-like permease
MLILAGIYGAMNILSFVALQYIGAGEFTICAQVMTFLIAPISVSVRLTFYRMLRGFSPFIHIGACILLRLL